MSNFTPGPWEFDGMEYIFAAIAKAEGVTK